MATSSNQKNTHQSTVSALSISDFEGICTRLPLGIPPSLINGTGAVDLSSPPMSDPEGSIRFPLDEVDGVFARLMPLDNMHCLELINPDNTLSKDPSYKLYMTTPTARVRVRCPEQIHDRRSPLYHLYTIFASEKYVIERHGNIVREFFFPRYFQVK